MWDKTNKRLAMVVLVLLVIALYITLNVDVQAQGGQYWYLTSHYRWEWYKGRQVRISYPVVCSGYICRPACHNYYGGWAPCRR